FKKLFTKEEIGLEDYTETRQVSKGSIYLAPPEDVDPEDPTKGAVFIGRIGTFIPVKEGVDGAGRLLRVHEGKGYAVTGTKGWMWARSSDIQDVKSVDTSCVAHLEAGAVKQVERFGQMEDLFEWPIFSPTPKIATPLALAHTTARRSRPPRSTRRS